MSAVKTPFFLSFGNGRVSRLVTLVGLASVLTLATARVHVRMQTTLIGYEIGRLKNDEAKLLEERSLLRMQLAKLTTKKHLMLMTDVKDQVKPANRTYALK